MSREQAIERFLETAGWGEAERLPLPSDASFRRYIRLRGARGSAMAMDAPPSHEDVRPFLKVAELLQGLGFSAPRILARDAEAGLLLLEDLGDETFTRALAAGAEEAPLYRLATDVLIALHRAAGPEAAANLPPYDAEALDREALLLVDWFLPAVRGAEVPAAERDAYVAAWRRVYPLIDRVPATVVLRDYHVDNLMILPGRAGIARCGLLDFQDALCGAVAYDLVSLLEDARRDVDAAVDAEMKDRYLAAFPDLDRAAFSAAYAVLGAQRSAKIVGIFTRLLRRDGKPGYLKHIPRVWRLLERNLEHPALAPVRQWFDAQVPQSERCMPERCMPERRRPDLGER